MALSVVFLACLARLFVCSLHLGGRLLEVHGALLRTLLVRIALRHLCIVQTQLLLVGYIA